MHKFLENILESSRNVNETTPWVLNYSSLQDLINDIQILG